MNRAMTGGMRVRDALESEFGSISSRAETREALGRTVSAAETIDGILAKLDAVKAKVRGFATLGENLVAIMRAERDGIVDARLVRAPSGANETDPTAGGFLVQTNFAQGLVGIAYEEAMIAPLCDRWQTDRPLADFRLPAIDEISRADGSRWGGSLAYWAGEAATVTPSLPRFKQLAFSAKKLIAIVYGTNELLADAPMVLDTYVRRAFAAEMGFKLDAAVMSGTGAGIPQGILNSAALITVAKTAGQAPGTIVPANVSAMWKRLPAPSRRRAIWLVHEDAEEQLDALSGLGDQNAALFLPAGFNGNAYPLLKGRPVIAVEQASPLGTVGDIVLADLTHYLIVDGGIKPMLSAHFQFTNDQVVWRFVLRVDGQSAFASAITPYKGSTTRSPFVTLAAR